MAPSTPPPPMRPELAALTITSASESVVMSPRCSVMRGTLANVTAPSAHVVLDPRSAVAVAPPLACTLARPELQQVEIPKGQRPRGALGRVGSEVGLERIGHQDFPAALDKAAEGRVAA